MPGLTKRTMRTGSYFLRFFVAYQSEGHNAITPGDQTLSRLSECLVDSSIYKPRYSLWFGTFLLNGVFNQKLLSTSALFDSNIRHIRVHRHTTAHK